MEKDSKIAGDSSIEEGRYRAEADKMIQHIQGKNVDNKAINLILEFSVGKIQDTIQAMVNEDQYAYIYHHLAKKIV